ncbi:efflux RND transporter periplasmic adaptor subunit [Thalassotalea nanhaiensis]|uniref:Efflux RND transporter periplasmic adaptor subunit n=1 Tax=Thalassotalea nanhaiensis TaxID=3065648 RepID=A0ABY9TH10_9GAMM|nr:efflux RND transporter periplasmic adaptor subunit [Colwelliaceae bacterium SQ345]
MKSTKFNLKAALLASTMLSSSMFLTGCNNAEAVAEEKTVEVIAIPVEVALVQNGDISSNYVTTTVLEPKEEAEVISKASGILEKLYVEEGQFVQAGDLLAEIEPERFQLRAEKAQAELSSLRLELDRINKVHSQKLVSTDTLDKLKWQYEIAKSNVKIAELDLKETKILAPISGYIAKRYVKEGNLVEQYQSQKLFHIVKLQVLESTVNLPEQELSKLRINQPAKLSFTAFPNEEVIAHVERISPVVDSETGTFSVKLKVENPDNKLKAGMFAQVKLVYDVHSNTKLLPKKALISMDNKHTVFTINDNKAHKTIVTLGYEDESFVEIIDGLDLDAQVVTTGQNNLKDQAVIQVIDAI